jgi:glutamate-ammonia-ligase adenylyltransferase
MDPRLRPTGKSGALAISRSEFLKYFTTGKGQLWERQALCKARPVYGSKSAQANVMQAVHEAILAFPFRADDAQEVRRMRVRLEETATSLNLKRGRGGTVDIEFIVQMLQLKYAATAPQVLVPGTLAAIDSLVQAGILSTDDAEFLADAYRFLRGIETGLRLMNTAARHDLPQDESELRKLAYLLRYPGPAELLQACNDYRSATRDRFDRLIDIEGQVVA